MEETGTRIRFGLALVNVGLKLSYSIHGAIGRHSEFSALVVNKAHMWRRERISQLQKIRAFTYTPLCMTRPLLARFLELVVNAAYM